MFHDYNLNQIYVMSVKNPNPYHKEPYENFLCEVIKRWDMLEHSQKRLVEETTRQKYASAEPLWIQLCSLCGIKTEELEEWFLDFILETKDIYFISHALDTSDSGVKKVFIDKIIDNVKDVFQGGKNCIILSENEELQLAILCNKKALRYIQQDSILQHFLKELDLNHGWDRIPESHYPMIAQIPLSNIHKSRPSVTRWLSVQKKLTTSIVFALLTLEKNGDISRLPWYDDYCKVRAIQEVTGCSVSEAIESMMLNDASLSEEVLIL